MPRSIDDLPDLLFDQLRDIHSVETQVAETLPHLALLATPPALRQFLSDQCWIGIDQVRAVTAMFQRHSRELGSDESKGMKGLIEGGNQHLQTASPGAVRDLMLVAHCLRIKQYEAAAYQFASKLAVHAGYMGEAELLFSFLEQERAAFAELDAFDEALYAERKFPPSPYPPTPTPPGT